MTVHISNEFMRSLVKCPLIYKIGYENIPNRICVTLHNIDEPCGVYRDAIAAEDWSGLQWAGVGPQKTDVGPSSAQGNLTWFTINMSSRQQREPYCGDTTVISRSYLNNGISSLVICHLYFASALFTNMD